MIECNIVIVLINVLHVAVIGVLTIHSKTHVNYDFPRIFILSCHVYYVWMVNHNTCTTLIPSTTQLRLKLIKHLSCTLSSYRSSRSSYKNMYKLKEQCEQTIQQYHRYITIISLHIL